MLSVFNFFNKVNFVFRLNFKSYIAIIISFLSLTILEILSLGLIIPYMKLVFNSNFLFELSFLNYFNVFESLNNEQLIFLFSFIFIFIFIIKTFLAIIVRAFIKKFSLKNIKDLQIYLMTIYQNINYEEFNKKNHSEYIRNIKELSSYCMTCLESSLRILSESIVLLGIFLFLLYIEPIPLLIISFTIFLFVYFYNFYLKPKTIFWGKKKTTAIKSIYQSIDEGFRGFKEIKVLGRSSFFSDFLKKGADEVFKNDLKSSIIITSPRYVLELVLIIFIICNLSLNIYVNGLNNDFFPILAIFAFAGFRILPSIALISNDVLQIGYFLEGLNIIYNDIKKLGNNYFYKTKTIIEKKYIENFRSIEFKNINFSYPGDEKQILNNTSITINANQFIGIIGASGSGKTTLLDIISGLLEPDSGQILLNGKQITIKDLNNLSFSYLPQENFIINDTLLSNIVLSYDKESIDLKKLDKILEKLKLNQLIDNLPNGIHSKIGENGLKLSGGQRQKICLARLLYHDREIMLLDEATNALDKESEKEVMMLLKSLKNKTIVLVSHDYNNIKNCDKIFDLTTSIVT